MKCPKCKSPARLMTKDSREWNGFTRRKKYCTRCGHGCFTIEIFDDGVEEMEKVIRNEILDNIKMSIDELRGIKSVWSTMVYRGAKKRDV